MTKGITPSYHSIVMRANKITFRYAKRLWLISHVMRSKSFRQLCFLCHSYLRWVDDFIDLSGEPYDVKKKFLERQKNNIDQLVKGNFDISLYQEEFFLYYFIIKARHLNLPGLINCMVEIFSSFEYDLGKSLSGKPLNNCQQSEYIRHIHKGLFDFIYIVLMKKEPMNDEFVGPFYWHSNLIRDLKEDVSHGIINLTIEEITKFSIDINNILGSAALPSFLKYKSEIIGRLLKQETEILQTMPVKIKFFWTLGYPLILYQINRIQFYNFKLPGSHIISIVTEFKNLLLTIEQTLLLFRSVFSYSPVSVNQSVKV